MYTLAGVTEVFFPPEEIQILAQQQEDYILCESMACTRAGQSESTEKCVGERQNEIYL